MMWVASIERMRITSKRHPKLRGNKMRQRKHRTIIVTVHAWLVADPAGAGQITDVAETRIYDSEGRRFA